LQNALDAKIQEDAAQAKKIYQLENDKKELSSAIIKMQQKQQQQSAQVSVQL
jgi:hypothetical protein